MSAVDIFDEYNCENGDIDSLNQVFMNLLKEKYNLNKLKYIE